MPEAASRRFRQFDGYTRAELERTAARLQKRILRQRKAVRGIPAWRGSDRERKRTAALASALAYGYLCECRAVLADQPGWQTVGEIPEGVRDAAANKAAQVVGALV